MWYVIYTGAGKEDKVRRLMARVVSAGVTREVFSPRCEVMRKYQGVWHKRLEPLLPGYLFVDATDPAKLDESLRSVPAFTRLLGSDGVFVPVDDSEMALFEEFADKDSRVMRMSTGVIEGDQIIVLSGPLRRHTALVKKIDRHKRLAYVELSILGRMKTVKVGLEIVRKS